MCLQVQDIRALAMFEYDSTSAGREDRIDGQRMGYAGEVVSPAFVSDHTSLYIMAISDCSRHGHERNVLGEGEKSKEFGDGAGGYV